MTLIEHPGWVCPNCGAWDSGSVMPRRATWCDGACSHPKVAMEAVSFVRAEVLQGAVEALRSLYRVALDMNVDADNVPQAREALIEAGRVLAAHGGQ
jgi:hypothetical protein